MPTITVQIPLKPVTQPKHDRLQQTVQRQNQIARTIADLMPSIDRRRWGDTRRDPVYHQWVQKEYPDNNGLRSHDANQAAYKVAENYGQWQQTGYGGGRPRYDNASWARFCNRGNGVQYEQNDGGRWSVRLPLEPYNAEWFWLATGPYQDQFLSQERCTGFGDTELKEYSPGNYVLNQTVRLLDRSTEASPETLLAVHLGINKLATITVHDIDAGEVLDVETVNGGRVRHRWQRFETIHSELQHAGQPEKVEQINGLEHRANQQQRHTIARRIIELADDYDEPVIVLEDDLASVPGQANERLDKSWFKTLVNRWAFADLQGMIAYKAGMAGVPVRETDAADVSTTCNKCGGDGQRQPNYDRFTCSSCGYKADADVNAAFNLAGRGH